MMAPDEKGSRNQLINTQRAKRKRDVNAVINILQCIFLSAVYLFKHEKAIQPAARKQLCFFNKDCSL